MTPISPLGIPLSITLLVCYMKLERAPLLVIALPYDLRVLRNHLIS